MKDDKYTYLTVIKNGKVVSKADSYVLCSSPDNVCFSCGRDTHMDYAWSIKAKTKIFDVCLCCALNVEMAINIVQDYLTTGKVYQTVIKNGEIISKANVCTENIDLDHPVRCFVCRERVETAWSIVINNRCHAICPCCAKTVDQAIEQLSTVLVKQELSA